MWDDTPRWLVALGWAVFLAPVIALLVLNALGVHGWTISGP
jgi:hypothetical protein